MLFIAALLSSVVAQAAPPGTVGMMQRVEQLEAENNDQQTAIDALDTRVTTLEAEEAEVCPASAPMRFVDNGDGTICDNQTGLLWEKKDAADEVADTNNPHDVDNRYSWSSTVVNYMDGTIFTDFLARLNGDATDDPDMPGSGFAGYTDWRLPNIVELQTIVDCSFGSPCIDPIFDPTAPVIQVIVYGSFTSSATKPEFVWAVQYSDGRLLFLSLSHRPLSKLFL